jgi:hypothetical protein
VTLRRPRPGWHADENLACSGRISARETRVEARARTLSSRCERQADTRRKILVGAIVLAKIEQEVFQESVLRDWLDAALTRVDDRVLFALPVDRGR